MLKYCWNTNFDFINFYLYWIINYFHNKKDKIFDNFMVTICIESLKILFIFNCWFSIYIFV